MNLIEMFVKGGWVMYPILISSIIGVAIIIDRFIVIRKSKVNVPAFLVRIRGMLKKKDIQGAISYCMEEKSFASNIIRRGLKKYKYGHQRVREAIESAGQQEVNKLEKGLNILASVAGVAPMLGFLGTVTGMISAFMKIESLAGAASPSDLAGGIWEALLTTAYGLAVGIAALMFYNYFLTKIGKLVSEIELITNDFLDVLDDSSKDIQVDDEELEIDL
ncbi:MAG: MotA/TolQ/ExbB proton channel family protein [Melioribacteraceae bacterium]|nr:MotA/TolQ/ExbB proton channel family protein [Melioribacteraceae bacterium]